MKKGLLKIFVLIGVCLILWWCKTPSSVNQNTTKLEIPIYSDASYKQHLVYEGYEVVLNEKMLIPEWVAYELTDEEVDGTNPRSNHFRTDPNFNGRQADDDDYRNSGWDRGHMASAADMKLTEQMMRESFYFTNICPQNHNLNSGDWKALEELVREYANIYGSIYVTCGPIVTDNKYGKIGTNQVTVPDAFYKIMLILTPNGYESIGFIMENKAGHKPLSTYAMTVDEVESRTGLDFFHTLPDDIEKKVESTYNPSVWNLE
ncbi:MAG: DNA/RNA non-specific endonuclease [Bacteroidaceae bacterium]|nr:DNA/RNA non-specific endonuclease [Bacteroidaceae bacterium]